MFRTAFSLVAQLLVASLSPAHGDEPRGVLLTWQRDPTTTMTIDWHVGSDQGAHASAATLTYQRDGDSGWKSAQAERITLPHTDQIVHRVELVGLETGTVYRFRAGDFGRVYSFRTMPADLEESPLVFAVGGDTGSGTPAMRQMNQQVMTHDPDFIVWGGDLAGDDGLAARWSRWETWLQTNQSTLITEAGRIVPIVVGIGNHEIHRRRGGNHYYGFPEFSDAQGFAQFTGDIEQWRRETAPIFYSLFAFPGQPGYGVLDFGTYLSLIVLDSDHTNPVEGTQTRWLEEVLTSRNHVTHRIPVYHVPAYPSIRAPESRTSTNVRRHWSPLFEQHGVRLAFEHHDHAYKRSVPIRDQQEHPNGVVYLGDGPWGAELRESRDVDRRWYLSHTATSRHAMIVTLHKSHQHVGVVDAQGQVIDEYPVGRIGLDGGLRHPDALLTHLADLLREPRIEDRLAAHRVLAAFTEAFSPETPDSREGFHEKLHALYASRDVQPAPTRRLAYQVLLMHTDFLYRPSDTEQLLRLGLEDPALDIRELAHEVAALDPSSDAMRLRDTLQSLRHDAVVARRESRFQRSLPQLTSQHREARPAVSSSSEPARAYRLPAEGWRIGWDQSLLGHEQQWYAPDFDDQAWEAIEIERPWHTPVPGEPYVGVAWYRTAFDLPEFETGGGVRLHFGGVDETAWVWVNGRYVGQHNIGPRGYNQPFELDVTEILLPGKQNQLTIRVGNTRGVGGVWQPINVYCYDPVDAP